MDWPLFFIIGNSNVKIKFAVATLKCLRLIECAIVTHELQLATCIVVCNSCFLVYQILIFVFHMFYMHLHF
jgi:hypothetical protein